MSECKSADADETEWPRRAALEMWRQQLAVGDVVDINVASLIDNVMATTLTTGLPPTTIVINSNQQPRGRVGVKVVNFDENGFPYEELEEEEEEEEEEIEGVWLEGKVVRVDQRNLGYGGRRIGVQVFAGANHEVAPPRPVLLSCVDLSLLYSIDLPLLHSFIYLSHPQVATLLTKKLAQFNNNNQFTRSSATLASQTAEGVTHPLKRSLTQHLVQPLIHPRILPSHTPFLQPFTHPLTLPTYTLFLQPFTHPLIRLQKMGEQEMLEVVIDSSSPAVQPLYSESTPWRASLTAGHRLYVKVHTLTCNNPQQPANTSPTHI